MKLAREPLGVAQPGRRARREPALDVPWAWLPRGDLAKAEAEVRRFEEARRTAIERR